MIYVKYMVFQRCCQLFSVKVIPLKDIVLFYFKLT